MDQKGLEGEEKGMGGGEDWERFGINNHDKIKINKRVYTCFCMLYLQNCTMYIVQTLNSKI